jgi:hypothetical protein
VATKATRVFVIVPAAECAIVIAFAVLWSLSSTKIIIYPKENLLAHTNSTCASSKKVRCNNSYIDMGLQTHAKPMGLGLE